MKGIPHLADFRRIIADVPQSHAPEDDLEVAVPVGFYLLLGPIPPTVELPAIEYADEPFGVRACPIRFYPGDLFGF